MKRPIKISSSSTASTPAANIKTNSNQSEFFSETIGLACGCLISTLVTAPLDEKAVMIRCVYSVLVVFLLKVTPLFSLQALSVLLSVPSMDPKRTAASLISIYLLSRRFPGTFRGGELILLGQLIGFLGGRCFEAGFQGWPSFFLLANTFPMIKMGHSKMNSLSAGLAWIILSAAVALRQNQPLNLVREILQVPRLILYWGLLIPLILVTPFIPRVSESFCGSKNALRKFYHFSSVVLFVPAAFWAENVLKVALACAATLFIFVETYRIDLKDKKRSRLISWLTSFMEKCRNELDSGVDGAVLSHIYLLVGCALPFWLSLKEGSLLQLSGVISLGVGDALASIGGKAFGRIKWHSRTNKTVEGSFCGAFGMFSMWLLIAGFTSAADSHHAITMKNLFITSIWSSISEALLPLNDNLSLPLCTLIIMRNLI